ncbi:Fc.00g036430.m01.CDS01 [Cosmosporella sp. VM-42]
MVMAAPKVFASEIVKYNDAELDRYLDENRRTVHVHDPKNLPQSFIQRLRDRLNRPSEAVPSRPVDLYQVSARLLQICTENPRARSESSVSPGKSPILWSGVASPLTPEEQYLQNLGYERRFYNKLVKHGAQPWYPIELIDEVSKRPIEHAELLRYWQGELPDENQDVWMVFGQQWERWKKFREWQGRMRKKFDGQLSVYIERCKKQLEKQSFTRSFVFDEDPKKQGKLTTWIEYMSYEYMRYDRVSWYKRREHWYGEAWKKLVDAKVLRPEETQEFIHSAKCTSQQQSEAIERRQAVELGRSALLRAHRDLLNPAIPSATAQESLAAGESQLDTAIQEFEVFKRRNDLIDDFKRTTAKYKEARNEAERHVLLLEWMRKQVPLIEQELAQKAEEASNPAQEIEGKENGKDGITTERGDQSQGQNEIEEQVSSPGKGVTNIPERRRKRGRDDDRESSKRSRFDPDSDDADSESDPRAKTLNHCSRTSRRNGTSSKAPPKAPIRRTTKRSLRNEEDGSSSKRSRNLPSNQNRRSRSSAVDGDSNGEVPGGPEDSAVSATVDQDDDAESTASSRRRSTRILARGDVGRTSPTLGQRIRTATSMSSTASREKANRGVTAKGRKRG